MVSSTATFNARCKALEHGISISEEAHSQYGILKKGVITPDLLSHDDNHAVISM